MNSVCKSTLLLETTGTGSRRRHCFSENMEQEAEHPCLETKKISTKKLYPALESDKAFKLLEGRYPYPYITTWKRELKQANGILLHAATLSILRNTLTTALSGVPGYRKSNARNRCSLHLHLSRPLPGVIWLQFSLAGVPLRGCPCQQHGNIRYAHEIEATLHRDLNLKLHVSGQLNCTDS